MATFSERVGAVPPRTVLQIEQMDAALRNSIWNLAATTFARTQYRENWRDACKRFAVGFFKTPVDEIPHYDRDCEKWMKQHFFALTWFGAYEFLIFFSDVAGQLEGELHEQSPALVKRICNRILEREFSGYRFVAGELAPITNPEEMAAIEEAAKIRQPGFTGAQEHIAAAVRLLATRPNPDFRNSIKESISSVESVAKIVTGISNRGLAPALEALAKKHSMHGALKEAFLRLYGFTSDEAGIRHALLDEGENIGFDEAKFMLVACSAFVNLVAAKVAKAAP